METIWAGMASAIWLGILTSISPCPLATNIAAISYIGKDLGGKKKALLSGLSYALGRTFVYALLGAALVMGALSLSGVSYGLQTYVNLFIGPVLIIAGMFLLELLKFNFSLPSLGAGEGLQKKLAQSGLAGAFALGAIFALAFCPVSAALFFGSLIPLSVTFGSKFLLPSLYGIGTSLPVLFFAFLIAFSAGSLSAYFNRLSQAEIWARRITGLIFIGVGLYLTIINVFLN